MTPTQLLIETRIGQNLDTYVGQLRDDGASWDTIAAELAERANVPNLNGESVRRWYGKES